MARKERPELTVDQIWEKIDNERLTFSNALKQKDKECEEKIAAIRKVAMMVHAQFIRTYGDKQGDEYVLEIDKPSGQWVVGAETTKDGRYRMRCKEVQTEE